MFSSLPSFFSISRRGGDVLQQGGGGGPSNYPLLLLLPRYSIFVRSNQAPYPPTSPHQSSQFAHIRINNNAFFSSHVSHLSQRETCGSNRSIVLPFSVFINGFAVWELFMGLFLALFYWLLFNGMHGNKSSDWEQLLHLRKAKAKIYKRSSG